jgi:hypothetical protein
VPPFSMPEFLILPAGKQRLNLMQNVSEILAMAEDNTVHHKTLKAAASKILGPEHPANSRAEILAALEEVATKPVAQQDEMIEVQIKRRYAPMGKYEVLEDDFPYKYEQVTDGPTRMVQPGDKVLLPRLEAIRALQKDIAVVTAASL